MLLSKCLRRVHEMIKANDLDSPDTRAEAKDESGAAVPPWSPFATRWTLEGALKRELPGYCVPEIVSRLVAKDVDQRRREGRHDDGGSIGRVTQRSTGEILTLLGELILDIEDIERIAAEADRYGLCLVKGQALDGSDWFDDRFVGNEDTE